MHDEPLPDWIVKRQERESLRASQAAIQSLQEQNAMLLIEKHAAEFFENLLHWLRSNLRSLLALKITASLTPGSIPEKGPQIYGVNLLSGEPYWKNIHATLQFQLPYGKTIRCSGEGFCIEFRLVALPAGDGIGAALPDQLMPLNAKQTAERIAKDLADQISPE